jgi:hypothetical protein
MHAIFWLEDLKGRELGRPSRRWEYNIRMNLRKMGWEDVEWLHLGLVAGSFEKSNEPSGSIKGGEFLD